MSACRLQLLLLLPSHGLARHAATAATDTGACPLPVCPFGSGRRKAKRWPLHILWLLKPAHSVCLTCELLPVSMAVSCMQQAVVAVARPHAHCSTSLEAGQIVVVTKQSCLTSAPASVPFHCVALSSPCHKNERVHGKDVRPTADRVEDGRKQRREQDKATCHCAHADNTTMRNHQQSEFATQFVFAAPPIPHWSPCPCSKDACVPSCTSLPFLSANSSGLTCRCFKLYTGLVDPQVRRCCCLGQLGLAAKLALTQPATCLPEQQAAAQIWEKILKMLHH